MNRSKMVAQEIIILLSTDSLSLPRAWNKNAPFEQRELATKFQDAYPYVLQRRLEETYPHRKVIVNNYANRFATILQSRDRTIDLFYLFNPTITIFQFGLVDCWIRSADPCDTIVPLEIFIESLISMANIKRQYAPQLPVFFLGINLPSARNLQRYHPLQREVTAKYNLALQTHLGPNCHYVDLEPLRVAHGESILHPDGQHFSNKGHCLVADLLYEEIKPLLKDTKAKSISTS